MLNDSQKRAVDLHEGPVRIVAGAGTGKTHTLIARAEQLLTSAKVAANEILVLTFTNKAAREFTDILRSNGHAAVRATTFHALAANLLRRFWRKNFSILTAEAQENLVRDILYSHERDDLKHVVCDLNNVRQAVSAGAPWPTLLSSVSIERLGELFHMYRAILEKKNALDFTGLLTTLLDAWNEDAEILASCRSDFRYVLVDEYQEATPVQVAILARLVELHRNVCVVGDPDQTIFSWRGATSTTLEDFMALYPDAVTITLTHNYRTPATILAAAESLIRHNQNRIENNTVSTRAGGKAPQLWESPNEWQMNETLFLLLEHFFGAHANVHANADGVYEFGDLAILYRTQTQGRLIAAHLSKKGYPFELSSGSHFWESKEVRRFLEKMMAVREMGRLPEDAPIFSDWLRHKLDEFIWNQSLPSSKAEMLLELLHHALRFDAHPLAEALCLFLDAADTAEEADNLVRADRIHLATLHAAKGMEFPVVVIVGLEEGTMPHHKLLDDPYWLAEERRLLYMGMTRAQEQLHLFTTLKVDTKSLEPSRFLTEIGPEHLVIGTLPTQRALAARRKQVKKSQLAMF